MLTNLARSALGAPRNLARRARASFNAFRAFSTSPDPDISYFCDPKNVEEIEKNIAIRKGVGDIRLINALKTKLDCLESSSEDYGALKQELLTELLKLPNRTHPDVVGLQAEREIKLIGEKTIQTAEFSEVAKKMKLIRTDQLGNTAGSKSYYVLGELAELEQALIQYVVSSLLKSGFELISVPDIIHRGIIEGCGMDTSGKRTQVYTLEPNLHGPDLCLSGTSEIALAGRLFNRELSEDALPLRMAAVSRCFRAETSNLTEERGIYRVHEFTKVEMFVVSTPEKSDETLEEIRQFQENCFESLGLHFRVIDMPPHDLGAPAYRKYDIEAWMSARKVYGEISSCSNCTDYQSRRLGIRCKPKSEPTSRFVHTLNGTACAIPRLLIALVEQGQNGDGTITVPEKLQRYMGGKRVIYKQKKIPELKFLKKKN